MYDEVGITCSHIKAVLLAINKQTNWCSRRYHISTYMNSYSANIPSMVVSDRFLAVDETFIPPDWKRPAGRPAKKRKDRSYLLTLKSRECKACGCQGHYAISCTAPSTEFRYQKHKERAIEWCRIAEATMIAE
jgi:hypothetical protein